MSTHQHIFSISQTSASSDQTRKRKEKKGFALHLLSVCRKSMLWETQIMKEKARNNAGSVQGAGRRWRSSHGVVERTASHTLLSLSCSPQHSSFLLDQTVRTAFSLGKAMRIGQLAKSPIQRLLHLSSPFGAGSRAEVVDAGEYKANCPTVLGARNFFHFQIEISPRRARQSLSCFVNRQSRFHSKKS